MLVVAFAAVAPAHAGSSCPTDTVEGQSLIGSWDGYVLSQVPDGYYTTANMAMVITENSSNQMFATMNLTAPTCSGKGCPSTKQPSGCASPPQPPPSPAPIRSIDPIGPALRGGGLRSGPGGRRRAAIMMTRPARARCPAPAPQLASRTST